MMSSGGQWFLQEDSMLLFSKWRTPTLGYVGGVVRTFFNHHLPKRWIGRSGYADDVFCSKSPKPPDHEIFLWGYVKDREIGSRVGRNQTTVMGICDHWIQEGTTNRRGGSHPPQCTTSREDRQIVCLPMTNRSVTSRTISQHSLSL
ncbi:transposable element Tcb1 transposase [Trichonephila clavipes]|nr:transposable element Tcb1 transposase [Trichonephila clavipes]